MTAPDPGLTDLIAAHREAWDSTDRWTGCSCGNDELSYADHPAHVALVVEQHTNGRTTELEATIARVREFADNAQGWFDSHQQGPVADAVGVLIDYLRAALEGEQQ